MADTVLVTGGFGLVGSATVRQLAADGRRVVIADLETPANVKKAKALPQGVEVRWADLTDPEQVQRLISDVAPAAIIHLAAIIAPLIYRKPNWRGGSTSKRRRPWCGSPKRNRLRRDSSMRRATRCSAPAIRTALLSR